MPAAVALAIVAIVLGIVGFAQHVSEPVAQAAPAVAVAPCDGGPFRVAEDGRITCLAGSSRTGA